MMNLKARLQLLEEDLVKRLRVHDDRPSKMRGAAVTYCVAIMTLLACGGGNSTGSGTSSAPVAASGSTGASNPPAGGTSESPTAASSILDRIDFGSAESESAHAFNVGAEAPPKGKGAFDQTYRQLPLSKLEAASHSNVEQLTFTLKVHPDKQNYLTVKLWGSDTQFGVLRMVDGDSVATQIDNNVSNGSGNPPFYGRFHYATTALPLALTKSKTTFTIKLFSQGYYYDAAADRVGNPTRPIYSAFTHFQPSFTPPAGDSTGAALVQVGTESPATISKATVYQVLKRSRANIYNLDGVPDGFWNPGGTLAHNGSVIPTGTPGAPPEVIGMHLDDGPLSTALVAEINASPNAADVWRSRVVGRQGTAAAVVASAYLTPPLTDETGAIVKGYDRYLDPAMLDQLIGIFDGQARSQGGSGQSVYAWDNGCSGDSTQYWGGVTSSPRASGPWAGTQDRHNSGCVSFADNAVWGRVVLRLLANPQAADALKKKLSELIDADLNGKKITRVEMYERMLAGSSTWMGFGLKALTSTDNFDKFGGTAVQAMIFVGGTYPAQLALRNLLAIYPSADADKQPMDPATMRTIVRQVIGLDDMVFTRPATPGWRIVTRGGLSETYGSLAAGYDGRYGGGIVPYVGMFSMLMKYDAAMSDADRAQASDMARKTIAAFDSFLYPQHQISTKNDGSVVDTYALGQEDVISWRVPYGPNANGWNLNLQTLAVDPDGAIASPAARRSFLINASRSGAGSLIEDYSYYTENEAAWKSVAGVDPASISKLSGEPGAADFVWADVDSGALALAYRGERLFMNANYNRGKGEVNQYARIHHITDTVDRAATVRMPFESTTQQDDGNLSQDFDGAWVVRYGRYLVVFNRSKTSYIVKFPAGGGTAIKLHRTGSVAMSDTSSVLPGDYEAYVLP